MAFIEQVNSKANVKQFTNNDLPFAPSQPVINSFYAVSTAGQTSIANLGFSIDTVNNPDVFFLFVDGKKLRLGSAADYQFAAIAADGTSSQITFNLALPAGLNIQAYKLGLKPEVQFLMDNRFTNLFEGQGQGFQGFVNTTSFISVATATVGTPAAGTFYSSITNRAPMADLSQDLKPRMGIERIMVENIFPLQGEFGPNGETVWGALNDTFGQIRYIGGWANSLNASGMRAGNSLAADYLEITFYGTGLNVLALASDTVSASYAVDGGSSTSFFTATASAVLQARNYGTNQVLPVVAGLTLGVHTVKIIGTTLDLYGFEILNESSSVKVNSGISYIAGLKLLSAAQSSFSYSAPVTGTRGGRVLVYQASDGTIGKAFQAVNTSQANLASADHTNEEPYRRAFWREMGAGRTDDFSRIASAQGAAFTSDDGTTTLVGSSVNNNTVNGVDSITPVTAGTDYMVFTFVGTGLDIIYANDANTGTSSVWTITVDGSSIGTFQPASPSTVAKQQKIVSGLPYGTHTVKFAHTTLNATRIYLSSFVIYQPKKPSLPSGAVELADYNVLANYAVTGVAATNVPSVSQGVIRKLPMREVLLVGASWASNSSPQAGNPTYESGFIVTMSTAADFIQYVFFGTGLDVRFSCPSTSSNGTISIDGASNFTVANGSPTGGAGWTAALTTSSFGNTSGISFTASTGVIALTPGTLSGPGSGVSLNGLTLGLHTVKVSYNSGSNSLPINAFDIITPIYSAKSNLSADLQNTLPVGSNAISDNRQLTPLKGVSLTPKAWAQAVGISSAPTTTATSFVPCPDLSLSLKTSGNPIEIFYSVTSSHGTANDGCFFQIYVDGIAVGSEKFNEQSSAGDRTSCSDSIIIPVSAGVHKVDVYWSVPTGTGTLTGLLRTLKAREIN